MTIQFIRLHRLVLFLAIIFLVGAFALFAGRQSRSGDDIPIPFLEGGSIDLRGQLTTIGRKQSTDVVRVTFPAGTDAETLQQDKIYLVSVSDDPNVPGIPLDQAVTISGSGAVDYFGYKYTSADAVGEKGHRDDPSFSVRFPGQFFASAKARTGVSSATIAAFEQRTGVTMLPAAAGGVMLERNALYLIVVNEVQPVTMTVRQVPVNPVCGDGVKSGTEACDDHNLTPGDGCSNICTIESGWVCTGTSPSACSTTCGDGIMSGTEACDDNNTTPGDGCSDACQTETGWNCAGTPSVCTDTCGNGIVENGETCDDGSLVPGDGCSSACTIESGWVCTGTDPSTCETTCGDGIKSGTEACDDHNLTPGDGCSNTCTIESGWVCTGTDPSTCETTCGDGIKSGTEACDDHNLTPGDGCSNICTIESGWVCTGTSPSACSTTCGDGIMSGTEACDDNNTTPGDGCSLTCQVESGWICTGVQPSSCTKCGNGVIDSDRGEVCDYADPNEPAGECDQSCRFTVPVPELFPEF